jgi:hypothetical protein
MPFMMLMWGIGARQFGARRGCESGVARQD